MVKFDDTHTAALIKRKKTMNNANAAYFAILFVTAVIVAATSGTAGENLWGGYMELLIVWCVLAAGFIAFNIFGVAPSGRQVKQAVAKIIAQGFYESEDLLKGTGEINFTVDYDGDEITVTRLGITKRIVLDPTRVQNVAEIASGYSRIKIDLTALKPLSSVYSNVGTLIFSFFQAYYFINCRGGEPVAVNITDNTGKQPQTFTVVKDGKPDVGAPRKNYYLKTEILK